MDSCLKTQMLTILDTYKIQNIFNVDETCFGNAFQTLILIAANMDESQKPPFYITGRSKNTICSRKTKVLPKPDDDG